MKKGKSIYVAAIVFGLVFLLSAPAMASFTPIYQPDASYTGSTINLMAGLAGTDGFTTYSSLSGTGMVVTFNNPLTLQTAPITGSWATWALPPYTESGTPRVLEIPGGGTGGTTLTMTLSAPTTTFGFELEPFTYAVYSTTVEFYNGAALVGSIIQAVDGYYGARLFAAQADPFTSVVVHCDDTGGFAIAQLRYNAVPIPGALWLFGPGLVGLAAVKRRFKK